MGNSNKQKSETLGMPYGTAVSRLKKKILFSFAQRLNEDVCFKCNKKIETVNELSIEHKLPWEGRSAELFWDLDNIAFSHMRCNKAHTYHGGILKRKIGPSNTAWCTICKKFEPVENFYNDASHWNGLQQGCKKFRRDRNPNETVEEQ